MTTTHPVSTSQRSAAARQLARARDLALVAVAVLAAILHIAAFRSYVFEDAYITYRYADNLAEGNGFAFNPGERVLGTSTPFYTLVLATLHLVGFDVATAGTLLYALCLSLLALGGAWLLRRFGHPNLGVVYALLILWGTGERLRFFGMETMLHSCLMLATLVAALERRERLTGILLACAFLTRYDAFVLVAALGVLLWVVDRRPPWKAYLTAAAIVLPWLAFAQLYFGSVFPNTLAAKTDSVGVMAFMEESVLRLGKAFFSPLHRAIDGPDVPGIVTTAVLLLLIAPLFSQTKLIARRATLLLGLLIVPLLLWIGYSMIGPPLAHRWYLVPALDLFLLFCGLAWGSATARQGRGAWAPAISLGLLAISLVLLPRGIRLERDGLIDNVVYDRRVQAYRELADWIKEHELHDLRLLTPEPGFLAYNTGNPVIDAIGLVSSGVPRDLSGRKLYRKLAEDFEPDMAIGHGNTLEGLGRGWFAGYHTISKSLYLSENALRDRLPRLAQDWLVPKVAPDDVLGHPLRFDFENGATGWTSMVSRRGFVGRPAKLKVGREATGDYLHTRSQQLFHATLSPDLRLDFDLLFLGVYSTHKSARLQLLVDGTVVLETRDVSRKPNQMETLVWPVHSWRGRQARLRLYDETAQGWIALDEVRSARFRDPLPFDDFESGTWDAERWESTFGEAPCRYATLARRHGLATILGRNTAASLCGDDVSRLVSRPFKIERDVIAFTMLDFGSERTRVELKVGGKIVRKIAGRRDGRPVSVAWDISAWQGQNAVLAVIDGERRPGHWIGIDDIVFFTKPEAPAED